MRDERRGVISTTERKDFLTRKENLSRRAPHRIRTRYLGHEFMGREEGGRREVLRGRRRGRKPHTREILSS